METKNEALELAQELDALQLNMDYIPTQVVVAMDATALLLRSQTSEIEQWCVDFAEILRERDKLKAKNQKLVDALESVVNVGGLAAVSVAEQALKENT